MGAGARCFDLAADRFKVLPALKLRVEGKLGCFSLAYLTLVCYRKALFRSRPTYFRSPKLNSP